MIHLIDVDSPTQVFTACNVYWLNIHLHCHKRCFYNSGECSKQLTSTNDPRHSDGTGSSSRATDGWNRTLIFSPYFGSSSSPIFNQHCERIALALGLTRMKLYPNTKSQLSHVRIHDMLPIWNWTHSEFKSSLRDCFTSVRTALPNQQQRHHHQSVFSGHQARLISAVHLLHFRSHNEISSPVPLTR